MRKYFFSGGIIAAVFGAIGLIAKTVSGPRNLRLALAWAAWAIAALTAIITVRQESAEATEYYARAEAERAAKRSRTRSR